MVKRTIRSAASILHDAIRHHRRRIEASKETIGCFISIPQLASLVATYAEAPRDAIGYQFEERAFVELGPHSTDDARILFGEQTVALNSIHIAPFIEQIQQDFGRFTKKAHVAVAFHFITLPFSCCRICCTPDSLCDGHLNRDAIHLRRTHMLSKRRRRRRLLLL